MNKKIIIKNESKWIEDVTALSLVTNVVNKGRIFNNGTEYNYVTLFKDLEIVVKAKSNKLSDSFFVCDYKRKQR